MATVDVPHLAFPFTRSAKGSVSLVEQDSPEHVRACQQTILVCPAGFRVERPEFGIPFYDYAPDVSDEGLAQALRRFEPRSEVSVTHVRQWAQDAQALVTIEAEA